MIASGAAHSHVFLGAGHARNERRTWIVIVLCGAMMVIEIVGGLMFGSIALVADGLHMSTHAGALFLAAMAYSLARRHAQDERFTFGAGKFGDLAGFTSAIVLAMIALLIGFEAVGRFFAPRPIRFAEAIPIAVLGLAVNIASALLLAGGDGHHHGHDHHHHHDRGPEHRHHDHDQDHHDHPHQRHARDNNMRAAVIHVAADAAVSVLVITGLVLARLFGWLWMDAAAGLVGAVVIASWSFGLIRDTGAILLDMTPDRALAERIRALAEVDDDHVTDLHLWRLGPGHMGAIVSVATHSSRDSGVYRERLAGLPSLSHLTVEVTRTGQDP
jgi:cation diffusion facilitator family transporter